MTMITYTDFHRKQELHPGKKSQSQKKITQIDIKRQGFSPSETIKLTQYLLFLAKSQRQHTSANYTN